MRRDGRILPAWYDTNRSSDGLYGGIAADWSSEAGTLNVQTAKMQAINFAAKNWRFWAGFDRACGGFAGIQRGISAGINHGGGVPSRRRLYQRVGRWAAARHVERELHDFNRKGIERQYWKRAIRERLEDVGAAAAGSHQRAVWTSSPSVLPSLLGMVVSGPTSDLTHVPVLNDSNGQYRMLGRPLLISEKRPAVGTPGDLILADLQLYGVAMGAEVSLPVSPHAYLTTDELAFRLRLRADGQPLLSSAITPKNGGDSLSGFVTIADRTS